MTQVTFALSRFARTHKTLYGVIVKLKNLLMTQFYVYISAPPPRETKAEEEICSLRLYLSLHVTHWFKPPTTPQPLPPLDSCLFSPTLSTDLIEGNHSDKKPPTMMLLHLRICARLCACSLHPTPPPPLLSSSLHPH